LVAWARQIEPATIVLPAAAGRVTLHYGEEDGRIGLRAAGGDETVINVNRSMTMTLPAGDYTLRPLAPTGKRFLHPARLAVPPAQMKVVPLRLVGEVARVEPHAPKPVRGLAVCQRMSDDRIPRVLVLSVGDDGTCAAWDPNKGAPPTVLQHPDGPPRCVAASSDGKTAATGAAGAGGNGGVIHFWDLDTLKMRPEVAQCASAVNALGYSRDGKWLVSGEEDGTIRVRDARTLAVAAERPPRQGGQGIVAIAFPPNHECVYTASGNGLIVAWNIELLKPVAALGTADPGVRSLVVEPPIYAGPGTGVHVWSSLTGPAERWPMPVEIQALAKLDSEPYLLTGDAAGVVRLWDSRARTEIVRFDGPTNGAARPVNAVAFLPGRRRAVSGASDGSITVWDLPWLAREIGAFSMPPHPRDPFGD
jgi:WD40 repeat protein